MNETNEMKELKLQHAIDQAVGRLVEEAEKLILDCRNKIEQIEANQIRNVMAVANSAPHTAVVTNFIRYQMGRAGRPSRAWKDTKLGEALVTVIDGPVQSLAQEAVNAAKHGSVEALNVEAMNAEAANVEAANAAEYRSVETVQVEMTRLLLGFMYRRYVYEAREQQSSNQQSKEARS
jgi:hypothetical protein